MENVKMTKDQMEEEIKSLEEKYMKSRNTIVIQNEAPVVADHNDDRKITTGDIANSQGAFVGIL